MDPPKQQSKNGKITIHEMEGGFLSILNQTQVDRASATFQ